MSSPELDRVLTMFTARGQLDRLSGLGPEVAHACLERARERLAAAALLVEAEHWESAYTNAYDAYRTAADALLLWLGYRVPTTPGGHRIVTDVAHVAMQEESAVFGPATAERFRQGRHESEYFDPSRPVDKTENDAEWAMERAELAIQAVASGLSSG